MPGANAPGVAYPGEFFPQLRSVVYVSVDPATETDTAVAFGTGGKYPLPPATETDTAPAFTHARVVEVQPAIESDTAVAITPQRVRALIAAIETDTAPPFVPATTTAGWPVSSGMNASVTIASFCKAEVISPPDAPPNGHVYLKRATRIMPDPVLGTNGWPDADLWKPTSEIIEDWGHFEIRFGGRDVTFYRGVPTQVRSIVDGEPFSDATAEIGFPQISAFESVPEFVIAGSVDIFQRKPDGSRGVTLFEGMVVPLEDGDAGEGLIVQCIGALYQLDFYLKQPYLVEPSYIDVGTILAAEITPAKQDRGAFRCLPLAKVSTGITIRPTGSWQPTLSGFCQDVVAKAQNADGTQWTVMKSSTGRRPEALLKDTTTVQWTMHFGQHGCIAKLSRDGTQAPNVIYGEGIDNAHCRWRNAKYPNLHIDTTPVFFGTPIGPAPDDSHNDSMFLFEREMHDRGWTGFTVDGFYSEYEETLVKRFQREAGIDVDGIIGPQTWAACFEPGSREGDLSGAYIAELFSINEVRQYRRNPQGANIGNNSSFDKNVVRVERFESFGAQISKDEGINSATIEVARDYTAGWVGTIELTADPHQGSRFEIRSGHNFLLKSHRGENRKLHVVKREIDATSEPIKVTLTVDEKARDLMTVGAIIARERESTDPTRRRREYRNRRSKTIDDTIPQWDCENGSGRIPRHATYRRLWNVIHIPAGKLGTIVRSRFVTEIPSYFAVGIFDRPVTAADLTRVAGDGPLMHPDYWDQFPDSNDPADPRHGKAPEGLIESWGTGGPDGPASAGAAPGGIWPSTSTDDPDFIVTGKLNDNASLYFESQQPPWLWIAIYVESGNDDGVNYFSGQLDPSNDF